MPADSFSRQVEVAAPPEVVWQTLTDVARVAGWVAVVGDVVEIDPLARYSALLQDRLGPFAVKADLDVVVTSLDEGSRITFVAEGEDRQVSSRITIEAAMQLSEREGGGTHVAVSGRYDVMGKVATLSSSTIRSKANKILDQFFRATERELGQ
jgi:carbon monoxide dehydrogenase subunit G